ncbi:hypothetical protein M8542_36265 [Amycolatopsis sp. OK19-0408]|uniref:Uncharacterized protein n=1 Tax=Amycolatopsis iheyensis TaxID=2945988 RepID=A0A9X2NK75_9PSEU|nr:hypothetical protein [Amycolatopsis iheyensis]MCR6488300.1 hypothetical protein [Amycolatopsis iheyensis]
MIHDSSPHAPTTEAAATVAPRSAAEHHAAAEALFTRAREVHPTINGSVGHENEYRRCLDWADMHLRLAEALTAGAGLLATQLRLKADGYKPNLSLGSEAYQWDTLLTDIHRKPEEKA